MKRDDPCLRRLSRLRDRPPAPAVDVAGRVLSTIRDLSPARARVRRWPMAACAAVCAVAAASTAMLAWQSSTQRAEPDNAAQFVIDIFQVDAQSLLP